MEESKLPSVTIVGLMSVQSNNVKSAYGDVIDLQFMSAESSPSRVKSVAQSSDHVILMTKFIPHEMQKALREHEGLVFCNGGVSSVGARLDQILATPGPEATQ